MSRLRWPDSTNSVSEKPGTIHNLANRKACDERCYDASDLLESSSLTLVWSRQNPGCPSDREPESG